MLAGRDALDTSFEQVQVLEPELVAIVGLSGSWEETHEGTEGRNFNSEAVLG